MELFCAVIIISAGTVKNDHGCYDAQSVPSAAWPLRTPQENQKIKIENRTSFPFPTCFTLCS